MGVGAEKARRILRGLGSFHRELPDDRFPDAGGGGREAGGVEGKNYFFIFQFPFFFFF